jgi:hypothetical protein
LNFSIPLLKHNMYIYIYIYPVLHIRFNNFSLMIMNYIIVAEVQAQKVGE